PFLIAADDVIRVLAVVRDVVGFDTSFAKLLRQGCAVKGVCGKHDRWTVACAIFRILFDDQPIARGVLGQPAEHAWRDVAEPLQVLVVLRRELPLRLDARVDRLKARRGENPLFYELTSTYLIDDLFVEEMG